MVFSKSEHRELREQFCAVGRWLYGRQMVVAEEGNISARLDEDTFMFTARGACLGRMEPDQMVLTNSGGRPRDDAKTPSSERGLHLAAYRSRPEIGAVLHAHPPWTLAATVAGFSLARPLLPQVLYYLGSIPTVAYATPGSEELARALQEFVSVHDAIALDRHGAVTLGENLLQAFGRMERVEQMAQLTVRVKSASMPKLLSREEVLKLRALRKEAGLNPDAILPDPSWQLGWDGRREQ